MPKCPSCNKEVYFAEKVTSLGKDWHRPCLKCEKCKKTLSSGSHAEHQGKPYCHNPCYAATFGPKGFGDRCKNFKVMKVVIGALSISSPECIGRKVCRGAVFCPYNCNYNEINRFCSLS
uniref:Cysteine-rich protein 2 n=1 Tax=Phallusia mammillata TaxID=59560 RepID=A0A6F9D596_9ASCI|nr:cysteine-rich protein 2 [Phallusia mammillata]